MEILESTIMSQSETTNANKRAENATGPSKKGNTDCTSENTRTDETSGDTERDMPRSKPKSRRKQENRSDREEALHQTQDDYNQIELDIRNEARYQTNEAILKMCDNYNKDKVDDIPYTDLLEAETEIFHKHFLKKQEIKTKIK
ncbi:hypothetical protein JTB14_033476 [Gonioctena quinquepunctata]|nr:hypothetical protein JTB14_033476 [Gonioctena quinquepunctata]